MVWYVRHMLYIAIETRLRSVRERNYTYIHKMLLPCLYLFIEYAAHTHKIHFSAFYLTTFALYRWLFCILRRLCKMIKKKESDLHRHTHQATKADDFVRQIDIKDCNLCVFFLKRRLTYLFVNGLGICCCWSIGLTIGLVSARLLVCSWGGWEIFYIGQWNRWDKTFRASVKVVYLHRFRTNHNILLLFKSSLIR